MGIPERHSFHARQRHSRRERRFDRFDPEIAQVPRFDFAERHDHEKVGRVEGAVDDRRRTEGRAQAPVALHQRRQNPKERARTGRLGAGALRAGLDPVGPGRHAPGRIPAPGRERSNGPGVGRRIGAGQTRAADHRVDPVVTRVGP